MTVRYLMAVRLLTAVRFLMVVRLFAALRLLLTASVRVTVQFLAAERLLMAAANPRGRAVPCGHADLHKNVSLCGAVAASAQPCR